MFQRRYLGTAEESTVYVAELNGIEMAVANLVNRPKDQRPAKTVIFSDCQAAIQAVQNPKRSSGQYVLSLIYNHVRTLRSPQTPTFDQIPIEIRGIPAHVGVPGNETADVEAKLAATGGRVENGADQPHAGDSATNQIQFPGDRVLLAATAKRRVRRRIKERWAQEWAKERTSKPNQRLVKAPDKKVLRLFDSLSKPYTSILIQMRSMRIALNRFLFKIKAVESDECYCSEGSQTPRHILMQCPLYADLRQTFLDKIRMTDLGDSTDYDAIVSHSQATRYVAEFMLQTGLLGQFRHVEIEPESPQGEENDPPG
jgi:ribonuclease HI